MNNHREHSVQATVIALTLDLIQDWGLDLEEGISERHRLVADLQFASVDIIQLCVAIEQHYERKLGFQNLLMVDGSYREDLSLGQLAEFVALKLSESKGNQA